MEDIWVWRVSAVLVFLTLLVLLLSPRGGVVVARAAATLASAGRVAGHAIAHLPFLNMVAAGLRTAALAGWRFWAWGCALVFGLWLLGQILDHATRPDPAEFTGQLFNVVHLLNASGETGTLAEIKEHVLGEEVDRLADIDSMRSWLFLGLFVASIAAQAFWASMLVRSTIPPTGPRRSSLLSTLIVIGAFVLFLWLSQNFRVVLGTAIDQAADYLRFSGHKSFISYEATIGALAVLTAALFLHSLVLPATVWGFARHDNAASWTQARRHWFGLGSCVLVLLAIVVLCQSAVTQAGRLIAQGARWIWGVESSANLPWLEWPLGYVTELATAFVSFATGPAILGVTMAILAQERPPSGFLADAH